MSRSRLRSFFMRKEIERTQIKIGTWETSAEIYHEPIGADHKLAPGESVFLNISVRDLQEIEVSVHERGVAFVLPYRDPAFVRDADGKVIDQV